MFGIYTSNIDGVCTYIMEQSSDWVRSLIIVFLTKYYYNYEGKEMGYMSTYSREDEGMLCFTGKT
jgi:hypothetical protein